MDDEIRLYKMKTMLLEALSKRLEELESKAKDSKISLEEAKEFIRLSQEISIGNYSRVIELDSILDRLLKKSDEITSKYKIILDEWESYKKYVQEKGLLNDFEKWVKQNKTGNQ